MANKNNDRYADAPRKFTLKRGTKYDPNILPVLQNLTALGMSQADLGMILGHLGDKRQYIKNMVANNPDAKEAVAIGRNMADINLVAQAYKSACGFEYDEVSEQYDHSGELIKKTVTKKFQKPEPNLAIFLLCNRMGDEFQSVHKVEVNKKETSISTNVEITRDQIAELGGKLMEMAENRKKIDVKVIDNERKDEKVQDLPNNVRSKDQ